MDCSETALLRKAGVQWDHVVVLSSAGAGWHKQHLQSPVSSSSTEEETPCGDVDRSCLLWEGFSVDDLFDFGGEEEQRGGEQEPFLQPWEAEEEEEARDGCTNPNASSSSALSSMVSPSSDPIVPEGDVEELEWVSRFVDDSYAEFTSAAVTPLLVDHHGPVPSARAAAAKTEALEAHSTTSSSPTKRSWWSCCFSTESVAVPAKARSKRSRTDGWVWSSFHRPSLLSESSSSLCSSASSVISCSGSSVTSCLLFDKPSGGCDGKGEDADSFLHSLGGGPNALNQPQLPQLQAKKKKGRKSKVLAGATAAAAAGGSRGAEQLARRRCSHCGVDKTPQWRAGPMGAKTLCNACGVRYKSGRLLPEYRPAGSPTFLSHVHSNSHHKVLEIRRSKEMVAAAAPAPAPAPPIASCSPSPPQLVAETRPYGVV